MSLIGNYHSTDGLRLLTSWRTVAAASRVVVVVVDVVVVGLPSNSIASWSTPVWRVRSRACAITSAVQRTCLQMSFTVDCSCSRCSTRVFAAVSSSAVNACHSSRIAAFQYQRVLSPEPHGGIYWAALISVSVVVCGILCSVTVYSFQRPLKTFLFQRSFPDAIVTL